MEGYLLGMPIHAPHWSRDLDTIKVIATAISTSNIPTTLFLGAGASIPSGAPTGFALSEDLTKEFFAGERTRDLSDISGRVELKYGRKDLVSFLRSKIEPLQPSKAALRLPDFNFANIFTTNYDLIVERAFEKAGVELPVVRSNKDYAFDYRQYNTMLFKLHGCITEDRADGLSHGMIITDEDYSTYRKFRQIGFQHFEQSLATSNVVFVGYSMADANIKQYVERAVELAGSQECPGQIFLILYEEDEIEAARWRNRGLQVGFGDLDALLGTLASVDQNPGAVSIFSPISDVPKHVIAAEISSLNPIEEGAKYSNINRMVTGSPVTYADIRAGNAFVRSAVTEIVQQVTSTNSSSMHVLLGTSGSGKTSAARLAIHELSERGMVCYEHKAHVAVDFPTWQDVEREHHKDGQRACLFLDEPNASQFAVNQLASYLGHKQERALSLIIAYHPSIWSYRTKSPELATQARVHNLSRLTPADIKSIATHVKRLPEIARLLSADIQSMTHNQIQNTIKKRARSDLFVSLKYLFETKSIDEIILKEFDQLGRGQPDDMKTSIRTLYETVALLEACGRHVHRQMVFRVADIDLAEISNLLDYLEGIIFESERDDFIGGTYQWTTRHPRIANIIAESKFSRKQRYDVLRRVIRSINPSSKIERQFSAQICNSEIGIESLPPKDQTELYKLLVETVPGERVPRHRLIRNLIRQDAFGDAELAISEARDMRINDSVIHRYDVQLNIAKAEKLDFLEVQDRLNLLDTAVSKATKSISRRPDDMYNYENYCKASLALAQNGGGEEEFEIALQKLKDAHKELGDPLMVQWIGNYESEMARLRTKKDNSNTSSV
ncbi:MAG: SIR2 family protein [Jhaorihella sp.]